MKQLSIEEKAKAYDEAMVYAKKLLKTIGNATLGNLVLKNEFKNMFPALKESEDERIRKAIIKALRSHSNSVNSLSSDGFKMEDVIAWLEKQGEQKIEKKSNAWSEEDEQIHRKCICAMRASACGFPEEEKFVEQVDKWLKSLKERYTWKPSDEQIYALRSIVSELKHSDNPCQETIEDLYNDLKRLRKE